MALRHRHVCALLTCILSSAGAVHCFVLHVSSSHQALPRERTCCHTNIYNLYRAERFLSLQTPPVSTSLQLTTTQQVHSHGEHLPPHMKAQLEECPATKEPPPSYPRILGINPSDAVTVTTPHSVRAAWYIRHRLTGVTLHVMEMLLLMVLYRPH